jgi:processive 1,2-diacylglycerol beta-glucosyltransferase
MQRAPKVLIFTMQVGSGHLMPAQSVRAALAARHPRIATRLVNTATDLGVASFEKSLVSSWRFSLEHPLLFNLLYAATRKRLRLVRVFDTIVSRPIVARLAQFLAQEKPDLVFCTHCTAANVIGRMKERGECAVPTVVFITDAFDAHAIWFAGASDYYIFPDRDRLDILHRAGIRPKQIRVMGFPLREGFAGRPAGRARTRRGTGARLAVLLAFGGEGRGKAEKQVRAILAADLALDLVVVCGRNDGLRKRLSHLAASAARPRRTRVTIHGYVQDMHNLLTAADVTMGKSGASFTWESLFCRKPFLITHAMSTEWGCRDFVVQHRVGWYAPRIVDQLAILRTLVEEPSVLAEYRGNCRRLGIGNGAPEIADFLAALADRTRAAGPLSRPRAARRSRHAGGARVDSRSGPAYHES